MTGGVCDVRQERQLLFTFLLLCFYVFVGTAVVQFKCRTYTIVITFSENINL